MAEANNSINFMAMLNPQFAAQQQKFALQQQIAQQIMQEGSQQPPDAQLANPDGMVIRNSPLGAASRGLEKALGAYMMNENIEDQANAYTNMNGQQTQDQSPTGQGGAPLLPWQTNAATGKPQGQAIGNAMMGGNGLMKYGIADSVANGLGKAMYEQDQKKQNLTDEAGLKTYTDANGITHMVSDIMGKGTQPNPQPNVPAPERPPAQPVNIIRGGDVPMAGDGKPLLPDIKSIPAPDPTGTPKFKTENTKTGVEQTIQDQKDAAEGNKAFSATAQSLGQEKARLDNLIQVYKDVQSGTLTAQNPEFFNKMAALGFKDDPQSIKDLAGVQNATQNHILQVIQQIKDTNANAGGGAPTRVFGSEISNLLENGESAKGQPEALWNVIGQAKGVVDHHLDMVNGWQKAGGLGNRLAGGYTMRPDDFAGQFTTSHNITDYRDKALKDMGPFKGMAGNNGAPSSVPAGVTLQDIQAEMARRSKK